MQSGAFKAFDWPNEASAKLATFALDQHMIAYYDAQPAASVEAFQFQHLSRLFTHAAQHSPWWRDHLREARKGATLDFGRLPLMTRDDYRASVAAAAGPLPLPGGHGAASANSTSGSSGVPVSFHTSALCGRMNSAHSTYDRTRQGVDPRRLFARLVAKMDAHPGAHVRFPPNLLYRRNEEFHRRSKQFTVEEHACWISEIAPGYVFAATTLLKGILDAYEDGAAAPPSTPVAALLSFAETVTPEFRIQARRVLGARVLDRYSCEEVGPLAFQCPLSDEHYHIASTNAVVEVLDDDGKRCRPDEIGRVHVTSLHNYASPLARYELGDLAAWALRCPCGYDKPVLSRLLGRKRFLIRLPSGGRQYVMISARHWLSVAPVREARVVQISEGVIRAECVLDRPMTAQERLAAEAMLKREISPDLTYEIAQVERIDWGPSYKRQDVISLI